MTNGSSQGLFVVVAVVIFGIFVAISYLLFQSTLKPSLSKIFCDALTLTSKNTGFDLGNCSTSTEPEIEFSKYQLYSTMSGTVSQKGRYSNDLTGANHTLIDSTMLTNVRYEYSDTAEDIQYIGIGTYLRPEQSTYAYLSLDTLKPQSQEQTIVFSISFANKDESTYGDDDYYLKLDNTSKLSINNKPLKYSLDYSYYGSNIFTIQPDDFINALSFNSSLDKGEIPYLKTSEFANESFASLYLKDVFIFEYKGFKKEIPIENYIINLENSPM